MLTACRRRQSSVGAEELRRQFIRFSTILNRLRFHSPWIGRELALRRSLAGQDRAAGPLNVSYAKKHGDRSRRTAQTPRVDVSASRDGQVVSRTSRQLGDGVRNLLGLVHVRKVGNLFVRLGYLGEVNLYISFCSPLRDADYSP